MKKLIVILAVVLGISSLPCLAASPAPDANMVLIPAGTFQMGDSLDGDSDALPIHKVTLSSFYMGKYDITNRQYCSFLNSASVKVVNGVVYESTDNGNSYPYCDTSAVGSNSQIAYNGGVFSVLNKGTRSMVNDPMIDVSWYGAAVYCNWCSKQDGYRPCYNLETWDCNFSNNGYHLPTEAQWEYAARGSFSGNRFPWGDTITHSQANYYSVSGDYSYDLSGLPWGYDKIWSSDGLTPFTSPVGRFAPNGYGLYDMAGNVLQWCNDWYSSDYYKSSPPTNPTGPASGSYPVLRGGSWWDSALDCRVASRYYRDQNDRYSRLSPTKSGQRRSIYGTNDRYITYGFRISLDLN